LPFSPHPYWLRKTILHQPAEARQAAVAAVAEQRSPRPILNRSIA
jgi:hypothetical protein